MPIYSRFSQGSGTSILGGFPRGIDISWPTNHRDEDGEQTDESNELWFVGQIDLAAVQAVESVDWLPEEGLIYLFWDSVWQPGGYHPDHVDGWCVHYAPKLTRQSIDEVQCWPESPELTALGEPDRVLLGFGPDDDGSSRLVMVPDLGDDPDEVVLTTRLAANGVDAGDDFSEDDPEVQAALARPEDWRVLLVLGPLDAFEWLGNRLFVLVEADRARVGDFSRAWVTFIDDED